MTAIACRDGIIAADSVGWTAGSHVIVPMRPKIRRAYGGGWFACCGTISLIELFTDWFEHNGPKPAKFDKDDDFSAIWLRRDGSMIFLGGMLVPVPIVAPYYAIGAPDRFMFGALAAGASAEQAVRLAIEHTDGAGGTVQVERVGL